MSKVSQKTPSSAVVVNLKENTASPAALTQESIILNLEELDLNDLAPLEGTALGNILENKDRNNIISGHTKHTSHSSHSKHSSAW